MESVGANLKVFSYLFMILNSYPTVVIVTKLNQNPIHGPFTELPTLNSAGLMNWSYKLKA